MAKFQSPLLGFNNNVRHKNRVFHIQTEDSGVNHPHIITHLFMDGGRILKSVKKSYAEHVGTEGMKETVRALMKDQHKAIFIALRDGQFDALVDGGLPAGKAAGTSSASSAEDAENADAAAVPASSPEPVAPPPSSEDPPPPTVVETKRHRSSVPPPSIAQARTARVATLPPPSVEVAVPVTLPHNPGLRPDGAAARAAVPEAAGPTGVFADTIAAPSRGVPDDVSASANRPYVPEPATGTRRTGEARATNEGRDATTGARPEESGAPKTASKPPRGRKGRTSRPPGEARYAPARPAAIFGSTQRPPPTSLFSDDLVSDKSLDEVILSYLAEDLEPQRRK